MLLEAIELFSTGEICTEMPILILGATRQHADRLKDHFHTLADVNPSLTIAVLFDSIDNTQLIGRDYRAIFIDHYAEEQEEIRHWRNVRYWR
jgi:hypothetical protein